MAKKQPTIDDVRPFLAIGGGIASGILAFEIADKVLNYKVKDSIGAINDLVEKVTGKPFEEWTILGQPQDKWTMDKYGIFDFIKTPFHDSPFSLKGRLP